MAPPGSRLCKTLTLTRLVGVSITFLQTCAGDFGYPFQKMHHRWREQNSFLLHLHFGKMAMELLIQAGTYTVTLTVQDTGGSSLTGSKTIQVE